jgi:hypothetical protein
VSDLLTPSEWRLFAIILLVLVAILVFGPRGRW